MGVCGWDRVVGAINGGYVKFEWCEFSFGVPCALVWVLLGGVFETRKLRIVKN